MMISTEKSTISQEKPWLKYYSEESRNAPLPRCKAIDYMIECNKDRLDAPALHYYGTDISFHRLLDRVDAAAKAFAALGVKAGDVVSFLSVGIPETIVGVYALNRLGATANTIDPRMDVGFIRSMILNSGSRILVTIDVAFPKVSAIASEIRQEKIIVQSAAASLPTLKKLAVKLRTKTDIRYTDQVIPWKRFIAAGASVSYTEAPYRGDDVVAITYTGGTTGFPKGVMMTNDSMNSVALNFIHSDLFREDGDRFLGIIPIFAAYGMVCGTHMPLCMRLTLTPIPRFIPAQIGRLVRQFRPQHMISTPVFIELLINAKELKGMDLSFLYTLASGGDSMNAGLEAKLHAFQQEHNMRFPLAQGYGMSELSAAATFCTNRVYKKGSVGIPSLTVTTGIFDPDTGEELGFHEIGEICVTGPSMMKGYFRDAEETDFVMREHADGQRWIHSGDLGYMDEDGFLYIKGRLKRMITRFDGHKVFPINLESVINKRPDVHLCAVVGVNDVTHSQGQYPLALVELAPGADPADTCRAIFEHCDRHVEERGKPVAVLAVDKLPLTAMGKVDNRALEKEYMHFDYTLWTPGR